MTRRAPGGRRGFTLIEVIIALTLLAAVGIGFSSASQQATRTLRRARLELNATRFLETEVERLKIVAYESLSDGSRTEGRGVARWSVADSTDFREVLLETRYGSPASGMIVDTVTIFRAP